MALLSLITDPLDYFRPSRLLDQHFGVDIDDDDFLQPTFPRRYRRFLMTTPYDRNWRTKASKSDKGSIVSVDQDKFHVSLDVQQFQPDEITVKTAGDNTIVVEGKHEEREDEHGLISRHFVRKYRLPDRHDIEKVETKLSSDGVLTITAPKKDDPKCKERQIDIVLTGKPSAENRAVNDKTDSIENGFCADDDRKDKESDVEEPKRSRRK